LGDRGNPLCPAATTSGDPRKARDRRRHLKRLASGAAPRGAGSVSGRSIVCGAKVAGKPLHGSKLAVSLILLAVGCGGRTNQESSSGSDASTAGVGAAGDQLFGEDASGDTSIDEDAAVDDVTLCRAFDQQVDNASCPPDCFARVAEQCPLVVDFSTANGETPNCVGQNFQGTGLMQSEYQCFSNGVRRKYDFPSQSVWKGDGSLCWTARFDRDCDRLTFLDGSGRLMGTLEPMSSDGYFRCPDGSTSHMTLSCWQAIATPVRCHDRGTCDTP